MATKAIKQGTVVTINGTQGIVYKGSLPPRKISPLLAQYEDKEKTEGGKLKQYKTATKVFVNLADTSFAAEISQRGVDGVGLLRAEFIISEIDSHPRKLIDDRKEKVFVGKLSESLKICSASFDPRPVIYRATDFTANEYKHLKGGEEYEEAEQNPLLGYRGASRYITKRREFNLELEAVKTVRNKAGLKNLWLSIPFVRSLKEMTEVKRLVTASGLHRSSSFKLIMMVEIPTNVVLISKFLDIGIDGVSIDLADLTMLMLGLDRNNEKVSQDFSVLDPAVLWALEHVITECRKRSAYSGIIGQDPSIQPELTEKLIEWGITSVSVSPDMIEKTREVVYEAERKLVSTRSKS